jgi:photosystem II oxygen-evolving enhancer protein 2
MVRVKQLFLLLVLVCSLGLSGCVAGASGLNSYADVQDGYSFLYPLGWQQVKVSKGPDVVFHDLINPTENISVVISPVAAGKKNLQDLGTPGEVGYALQQKAIAPPDSGRTAELVDASARQVGEQTYYTLEYAVKLPNQERHDLATVVIHKGRLYTFNASTTEQRWPRAQKLLHEVVDSFSVQ